MLDGKKTYVLAIAAVLGAIAAYMNGTSDMQQALEMAWAGGVAATLRHGLARAGLS